jgi:hypothetical protein
MTLKSWGTFCRAHGRYGDVLCSSSDRARLNRFRARYVFARRLTGISATGYSEHAQRGYCAGLRVQLAANAAEVIGHVVGEDFKRWNLDEPDLAGALRNNLKTVSDASDTLFDREELRELLRDFIAGRNDVRVAATAVRILFAHGTFTPSVTKAMTRRGAEAFHRLADVVLDGSEQRFVNWFGERMQRVEAA